VYEFKLLTDVFKLAVVEFKLVNLVVVDEVNEFKLLTDVFTLAEVDSKLFNLPFWVVLVVSFDWVYEFNEERIPTTCNEPLTVPFGNKGVICAAPLTIPAGMFEIPVYDIWDEPLTRPVGNNAVTCAELLTTVFASNCVLIVVFIEDVNDSKLLNLIFADDVYDCKDAVAASMLVNFEFKSNPPKAIELIYATLPLKFNILVSTEVEYAVKNPEPVHKFNDSVTALICVNDKLYDDVKFSNVPNLPFTDDVYNCKDAVTEFICPIEELTDAVTFSNVVNLVSIPPLQVFAEEVYDCRDAVTEFICPNEESYDAVKLCKVVNFDANEPLVV